MFEVAQYSPLLHTRLSEVRGFRELPESTKDLLLPLFVLRPWPRANSIEVAIDRIVDATGGRLFGLDLERNYPAAQADKPAQVEFDDLRSPTAAFDNYYQKISSIDGAVPVLQLTGDISEFSEQVQKILNIGRGGFVHITRADALLIPSILLAIANCPADAFSIFIDAEWQIDILQQSAWALAMAQHFFDQSPDRPIVICGSSFPVDFSNVASTANFSIGERNLFINVRNNLNANLIYGDWGSTRPPAYDEGIRRTVARIDLASAARWEVFRSRKVQRLNSDGNLEWVRETYQEVADRVRDSDDWNSIPSVWGRYAVECTADDLPSSIRSPITAAAARINLHLHAQAHFNTPELLGDTDDPYID